MLLLFGAFIAGILTVLAPCVLPLLPIIIGGSVSGDTKDRRRPVLISVSLAISLIVFTLLLKATSLLINISPAVITYVSGGILIILGVVTFFPNAYGGVLARLGIERRAQKLLGESNKNKRQFVGPILTGAALGPVFSSCSPVYAYILATVLPANFGTAMAYILAYVLGLALVLLLIGHYGQRFISRIRFASNPKGVFQRSIAVIFILVGIMVATGYGVKLQTYVSAHTPFNFDALTASFLPKSNHTVNDKTLYNVDPYPAPELAGIQAWINSNPLTLAQLKGKVVLVDFWTYSCINCIRSLPYVEGWSKTYQDQGLVVIGVQAPEFAFEKVLSNVQDAVKKDGITYPVALDNNLTTWDAFENQYWPAEYLINQAGQVVRVHTGEGEYDQTEQAIRGLLAKNGATLPSTMVATSAADNVPITAQQSPETYLGTSRAQNYVGTTSLTNGTKAYNLDTKLSTNEWSLGGTWQVAGDKITAQGNSILSIHVAAKNVYIVGGSSTPQPVGIILDGQPISGTGSSGSDVTGNNVTIGNSTIYNLVSFPKFSSDSTLELSVPTGVDLNVFTFGS